MKVYRIGLVGYGTMGREWARHLRDSGRWQVARICDVSSKALAVAKDDDASVEVTTDEMKIFDDDTLDAVGLFTLANDRPRHIRMALAKRKHILSEKPIAADVPTEWDLLGEIESSELLVGVNLFNRNAWYHREAQAFIASGEIGDLAVVRANHQTPGRVPGEGHVPEGPPFHDCGMHYVDVVRWYAQSEFDHWHAQGLCMWGHSEPWWVQAHGAFRNGVVFEVTQGFGYGQLAQKHVFHCGLEAIGTRGVVRMEHNFETVNLRMHGTGKTIERSGPYGAKKLDVFAEAFARSLDEGRNVGFPGARDSVIASQVSQQMLDAAAAGSLPMKGDAGELAAILQRHRTLREEAMERRVP